MFDRTISMIKGLRYFIIVLMLLACSGLSFAATETTTASPLPASSTASNPLKLTIPSGMYSFGFYSDSSGIYSLDTLSLIGDVSTDVSEWGSPSYKYYAYGTFFVNWRLFTKNAFKLVLSVPKMQSASGTILPYVDFADTGMTAIVESDGLLVKTFNSGAIDVGSKQFSLRVNMKDSKSTDVYSAVITLKVIAI